MSSFDAATPFVEEMKKHAKVLVRKECTIDNAEDRAFYFTFPELTVELVDTRGQAGKKSKKILSINIHYFIAFKIAASQRNTDKTAFFKDLAIKTAWPFFTRDVVDYTTKAGFSPIYLDPEFNSYQEGKSSKAIRHNKSLK